MKSLNGFGKKYFSLSSIQAHSVAPKLHAVVTSCKNHLNKKLLICNESDDKEESPPNLVELISFSLLENNKPCHCDCFFRRKTALAVRLFRYIPRCPFYCTFFAFRRTGVHPPLYSL